MPRLNSVRVVILILLVVVSYYIFLRPTSKRALIPRSSPLRSKNRARGTTDEEVAIKLAKSAEAADLKIRFLDPEKFETVVLGKNVAANIQADSTTRPEWYIVFFGIQECPYCQAFTPVWLEFQSQLVMQTKEAASTTSIPYSFRPKPLQKLPYPLHVAKFDCTKHETYCDAIDYLDGYPSVILYKNGKFVKDLYNDETNLKNLWKSITEVMEFDAQSGERKR